MPLLIKFNLQKIPRDFIKKYAQQYGSINNTHNNLNDVQN